jgi:hypothetical protein
MGVFNYLSFCLIQDQRAVNQGDMPSDYLLKDERIKSCLYLRVTQEQLIMDAAPHTQPSAYLIRHHHQAKSSYLQNDLNQHLR